MIIDVNAWTGPWPALVNVPFDVASVRSSLRAYGVKRIFMAPLAAAWSANPHLCNQVVYEAADEHDDISPVPVIDPTLPTWPEELPTWPDQAAAGLWRKRSTGHRPCVRIDDQAAAGLPRNWSSVEVWPGPVRSLCTHRWTDSLFDSERRPGVHAGAAVARIVNDLAMCGDSGRMLGHPDPEHMGTIDAAATAFIPIWRRPRYG